MCILKQPKLGIKHQTRANIINADTEEENYIWYCCYLI